MRTETDIKIKLNEYKQSLKHRDPNNILDKFAIPFEQGTIEILEWVLEEEQS